jgi:hypothetical protein
VVYVEAPPTARAFLASAIANWWAARFYRDSNTVRRQTFGPQGTVVLQMVRTGDRVTWIATADPELSEMSKHGRAIKMNEAAKLIADATVRGSGASSVATQGELRANLRDQAKAAASGDTGPGISTGLGTASGSRRGGISPTQGAATEKSVPETDSDGNDDAMYSLLPKDQASSAESERMAELAGEEIVSGTERGGGTQRRQRSDTKLITIKTCSYLRTQPIISLASKVQPLKNGKISKANPG